MAPLTLTILGAGPAAPNPGGANSGYLVRHGDTAVVLDCGPGTAGKIALHVPVNVLDAAVISHIHPDHYFDLVALYYLQKYGDARPPDRPPNMPLWLPPGGRAFMDRLGRLIADRAAMLEDVFSVEDYVVGRELKIGTLTFTFHPVQHYVASNSMRIRADSGAVLVFSSDVAPCPELVEAARGADLFLCESALLDPSQDDQQHRGHMSAIEASAAARDARVNHLVITHYRSSEQYDAHHLSNARKFFEGQVDLAREGQTYMVG